jgi:hypothetical protein
MSNRLFVTGMFRSGTTLFARMLHAHRSVACASDPFRPFFNCFRDAIAADAGVDVEPFAPLDDYFASEDGLTVFDAVQTATMDRPFPADTRTSLLDRTRSHAEPFSPKVTDRLDGIRGDSFRDVFDDLLSYVPAAYGNGDEKWVATKEVWTTEFTPALARAYPESKFVHVVRDPRAVCASKNVQANSKYSWLFLTRQWRKIATLARMYDEQFPERVHVVRYEDLVRSPRATVLELCEFLDIDMDDRLLDPSNFVDGSGDQWLQNSSYEGSTASFDTSAVSKWREVLTPRQHEYVEQLCYSEMLSHRYTPDATFGLSEQLQTDPPRVPDTELADWITEYYGGWSLFDHVGAVADEALRQRVLSTDQPLSAFDDRLLRGFFFERDYAATARELLEKYQQRDI